MSREITPFEQIRRTNPAGNEFWSSRDFAKVLGYADYRNFQAVIESARTACFNSGQRVEDHFVDVTKLIEVANLFRATQTEEKLRREKITGKTQANQTHYEVGRKVRQTIKELRGTMPENLPTAPSIKKLEGKPRKELGGSGPTT